MNVEPLNPGGSRLNASASFDLLNADRADQEHFDLETLTELLLKELGAEIQSTNTAVEAVAQRLAIEVDRVCAASPPEMSELLSTRFATRQSRTA